MIMNEKYKGDAILQKTYTVDFLTKKRVENNGQVPKYYVEESHPAIIDKDTREAVQLEMERRKAYAKEHRIKKLDYATTKNPFAGRVVCGQCGRVFGRKTWTTTDKKLKRIIWQCNNKYLGKGVKGCTSKHIDDKVLDQAFIDTYNSIIENIDHFMDKWKEQTEEEDILKKVTAKRFMDIFRKAESIKEFDVDWYFKVVEKITVHDGVGVIVSLLDGTENECGI